MAADAFSIGQLVAHMGLDTTQYQAGMASVQASAAAADAATKKAAASMTASMAAAGVKMQAIGKKMTQYMTLPIIAIGLVSTKVFTDFEANMEKIVGLVGVAKEQVEAWKKEVLAMGPATGQGPEKLAEALFFITSAGIRGAEAMEVLEMSAKAATGGMGEAKVIADLVTSAMNAYGKENLNAAQATDILTATVREGKAEAASLAMAMGMVLPIASEYGVTFDQVGAAFAGMTRTGTNARVAATQLKAILSSMASPALKAEDAMKKYGTSSAQFRKDIEEEGLIQALGNLKTAVNGNKVAMAEIFPNIRGLMGVLDLLGKNAEQNIEIFDALTDAGGSLDTAFESATDTVKFKLAKALATAKTRMITLGESISKVAIPAIEKITILIAKSTERWDKLSEAQKETRVKMMAITAAAGPLLVILGKVAKVIAANPYLAAAAAVIALTMVTIKFVKSNRELFNSYDAVANANKKVNKQYQEQALQVRTLVRHIENENLSNETRLNKINELKLIMPEYNAQLTEEGKLINHNTTAIEDYLTALKDKIRAQVFEDQYTEALKSQLEVQDKLATAYAKLAVAQVRGIGIVVALARVKRWEKQAKNTEEAILDLEKAAADLNLTFGATPSTIGAPSAPTSTDAPAAVSGIDYKAYFKRRREYIEFHKQSQKELDDAMTVMMDDMNKEIETNIAYQLQLEEDANRRRKAMDESLLQDRMNKAMAYVQIGHELASTFGAAISGQEGAYKSMVSTMLSGTDKIIQALLAQAIAGYIANKAAIPGGLIAAAIGVPILLSMWNNLVPSFKEGAIAYGPTMGIFGEYPGARQDPEVVAPLSKLQTIIGESGGGKPQVVEVKIRRRDLIAVIKMDQVLHQTY